MTRISSLQLAAAVGGTAALVKVSALALALAARRPAFCKRRGGAGRGLRRTDRQTCGRQAVSG